MKQKIARFISVAGHPLLTIPLYVALVTFASADGQKAAFNSFLIIGCIFVPLILWLYLKSKNGSYTNFDVSDRKQRKSVFVFIIPILCIVTFIVYKTGAQSNPVFQSLLFALILVTVLQISNFYIKSSLHVSFNIYLSFLVMGADYKLGIIVLLLTIPIAWSRIELSRHTLKEVITGGTIGLVVSVIMFHVQGHL